MAQFNPTIDQRAVIEHDGGALLVSAAAGSGKTKVLVERLLAKVCDPVSPKNVDEFLIITFTQAAAAELRSRILAEISQRLSEDPGNRHLRNQLTRVYMAQISTVHSFCTEVLRDYAHHLDIPADFRVCDETESDILKQQVLQATLGDVYDHISDLPNVEAFLDSLGFGRDDRRAAGLILEAYRNTQSHAWPEKWVEKCCDYLRRDDFSSISETVWGAYLLEEMKRTLSAQIKRMQEARSLLPGVGGLEKYLPVFDDNIALLQRIYDHADWDSLSKIGTLDFGTLPAARKCDDVQIKTAVQNIRNGCKKAVNELLEIFSCDGETALEEQLSTHKPLLGLMELLSRFNKAYSAAKLRRRVLDFSDLEHQTICLVTDPYTGGSTAVAKELGARFCEIMVDEYQDTNEAQDTIFRSISKAEENLFMVGDVKQSIYRFRLADPGIFLEKYRRYTLREENNSRSPRKILLSENFRSRPAVIDAANHTFKTLMSEQLGDLAYTEAEQLRTSRNFPELGETAVELHLISSDLQDGAFSRREEAEAAFVASQIEELLSGEHYISENDGLRRITADDIAILMRATSVSAPIFAAKLRERGIPVAAEKREDVLASTEVQTMLAFLRVVDNPRQDIPLVTALSSPVGGFTADELAAIRGMDRHVCFYDALLAAAKEHDKAARFLEMLSEFRAKRQWMELLELFDLIALRTSLYEVFSAAKSGQGRCSNLKRLREYCAGVRSIGVDSLAAFLRHMDALREQNVSLPAAAGAQSGVTISTIHKSKGLEFPVVFLCDLFRSFSTQDQRNALQMDTDMFLGCDVVDKRRMVKYPSTAKNAVALKKERENKSEELRLLYVAMTRAKDRLIMTYCGESVLTHIKEAAVNAAYPAPPCVATEVSSMGKWMLLAAAVRPEASHLFGGAVQMQETSAFPWKICYHESPILEERTDAGSFNDVEAHVDEKHFCLADQGAPYRVPFIPAKLTATELKGRFLDAESAEQARPVRHAERGQIRTRNFDPEAQQGTAFQRGIAMHLFMQYCRYEACTSETGVREELERLVCKEHLSRAQADTVDVHQLVRFFQSQWGEVVRSAEQVRREFKFSLLADAGEYFSGSTEQILLQGVVDCFVITEQGIVVLDYKTDRVQPGAEGMRAADYAPQLSAYSMALERIYGLPVWKRVVYFFATGASCEV